MGDLNVGWTDVRFDITEDMNDDWTDISFDIIDYCLNTSMTSSKYGFELDSDIETVISQYNINDN